MIGVRAQHGHKQTSHIAWKGKTFSQITTILKNSDTRSLPTDHDSFMRVVSKPLPLKGYRKEIASKTITKCNPRSSQTLMRDFETPGGTIIRANFDENGMANYDHDCNGLASTLDIHRNENKYENPSCDNCHGDFPAGSKIRNLTQEENARRRVRSSGMDRELGKTKTYYTSTKEYLHSRSKRFQQNEFHSVSKGGNESDFRTNTVTHCTNKNSYVPVHYKPNNEKFAQQGAVDASSRLTRLKYDVITDIGNTYRVAFDKYGSGNATANALAYGVPANGYTIKDKIGYQNICSPTFCKSSSTENAPHVTQIPVVTHFLVSFASQTNAYTFADQSPSNPISTPTLVRGNIYRFTFTNSTGSDLVFSNQNHPFFRKQCESKRK